MADVALNYLLFLVFIFRPLLRSAEQFTNLILEIAALGILHDALIDDAESQQVLVGCTAVACQ